MDHWPELPIRDRKRINGSSFAYGGGADTEEAELHVDDSEQSSSNGCVSWLLLNYSTSSIITEGGIHIDKTRYGFG